MTLGTCPPGVAAGQPMPVNMAYFGGKVQVTPKIYLVLWGWGEAGAFNHTAAGHPANDPDGTATLMTRFIAAIGGTSWEARRLNTTSRIIMAHFRRLAIPRRSSLVSGTTTQCQSMTTSAPGIGARGRAGRAAFLQRKSR